MKTDNFSSQVFFTTIKAVFWAAGICAVATGLLGWHALSGGYDAIDLLAAFTVFAPATILVQMWHLSYHPDFLFVLFACLVNAAIGGFLGGILGFSWGVFKMTADEW